MSGRTALVIVLDALGLTTLNYLLDRFLGGLVLPNLSRLGLGGLVEKRHAHRFCQADPLSYAAALNQSSATADSTTGHREMVGIVDARIYNLFPNGFPYVYIADLERRIGRKTMLNKMGAGVEVIERHALDHAKTGWPIVYASICDPLIQIAMDEAVVSVKEQHRIAETALALAIEMGIPMTRAIARSFICTPEGECVRTANRHDAVLPIGGTTLVDILRSGYIWTTAVGKTADLVNVPYHEIIKLTDRIWLDPELALQFPHPKGKDTNPFVVQGIINALRSARAVFRPRGTFVFANLVDTDALYGHTRDVEGALKCLEEFDRTLPIIERELEEEGILIITADHGMEHRSDYGYHSREAVPLLVSRMDGDLKLKTGTGEGFTEVGMLVAQFFNCEQAFRDSITHIPAWGAANS